MEGNPSRSPAYSAREDRLNSQIGAAVDPGYHQIGRGRQDMARAHDYAMGGSAGDAETTIAKSANAQWGVQADGECDTPL